MVSLPFIRLQVFDRDLAADHGTERIRARDRAYGRPVNLCRMAKDRGENAEHPGTMSAPSLPPDGSYVEMTSYGETHPEVRVVHASGTVITLSLAMAQVPPANSTVELRWAAAPRGRYAQQGHVVGVDGNRVEVRFTGHPAVLQSRSYVRGGGGEPVVMSRPGHDDAVGLVHDMSERAVRAHFTDVELHPGDEMTLSIQVGDEVVSFPATTYKVNSLRQQVPRRGPLSVEMVAVFDDQEEVQARVIRRYIMRNQLLHRNRSHD
ncbi:hypothetical protein Ato02nite_046060 [Paractinoplanes toevensis]|uniref:PilZ domain-containing protein n=2 Tax=Paractinoplanes toevensis TaxID=571911 RepID=A0A919TBY9_9ACTN|nr:hypothetical protein Ato02nite_046060 [Actinoplanes toevensis]